MAGGEACGIWGSGGAGAGARWAVVLGCVRTCAARSRMVALMPSSSAKSFAPAWFGAWACVGGAAGPVGARWVGSIWGCRWGASSCWCGPDGVPLGGAALFGVACSARGAEPVAEGTLLSELEGAPPEASGPVPVLAFFLPTALAFPFALGGGASSSGPSPGVPGAADAALALVVGPAAGGAAGWGLPAGIDRLKGRFKGILAVM